MKLKRIPDTSMAKECLVKTYSEIEHKELFYYAVHSRRYLETLKAVSEHVASGKDVLEIGVLYGHIAKSLKNMGYGVAGTDLASEIDRLKEKYSGSVHVVPCDLNLERLPFRDKQFDCVVFTEVLEHLHTGAAVSSLYEVARVLKPKGILVLSTPNAMSLLNRVRLLFGRLPRSDVNHIKEYSENELLGLLGQSGFVVKKSWFSMCIDRTQPYNPLWKKVCKWILYPFWFLHPLFRTTIFIVGERQNGSTVSD